MLRSHPINNPGLPTSHGFTRLELCLSSGRAFHGMGNGPWPSMAFRSDFPALHLMGLWLTVSWSEEVICSLGRSLIIRRWDRRYPDIACYGSESHRMPAVRPLNACLLSKQPFTWMLFSPDRRKDQGRPPAMDRTASGAIGICINPCESVQSRRQRDFGGDVCRVARADLSETLSFFTKSNSPSETAKRTTERMDRIMLAPKQVAGFHENFISFRRLALAHRPPWDALDQRLEGFGISPVDGCVRIYRESEAGPLLQGVISTAI